MAIIARRGTVPQTPHTEFYASDHTFTLEEIHGSYGFSGPWSRKIHIRSYPTELVKIPQEGDFDLLCVPTKEANLLQPWHIRTGRIPFEGDAVRGRKPLAFGPSTAISVSKPNQSMPEDSFFRNGEKHELYFVQEGRGAFRTEYGTLKFREHCYVSVPKGTTYRVELETPKAYLLIMESDFPIEFPRHYINPAGQATLMSPVVETEVELPEREEPIDRRGEYPIDVKHGGGRITRLTLGHHPFDLVGWEGALYPFLFDIKNHHGIAREIHAAPPAHQTFQLGSPPLSGFAVCSFVPQMEDWHPKGIPAPYAHSNVDCDECMFFANPHYGARQGVIEPGSLTLHPSGLPHSPQGDAALRSRDSRGKISRRLAVMVDTFFESLKVTEYGANCADPDYAMSWHNVAEAESKEGASQDAGWTAPSK